ERACSSLFIPRGRRGRRVGAGVAVGAGGPDDGQEDLLQGRLLLDVLDRGRREELPEVGQGRGGVSPPKWAPPRRVPAAVSWKRASRASASWPASGTRRSRATRTRFSRPLRTSSTAANWPVRLI